MGFHLTSETAPSEEVRRIVHEQIDKAIAEIEGEELDLHESIHQARKRCKKIRGVIRLVRPCLGSSYSQENAWYRDGARSLSGVRDAQALVEAFDELLNRFEATIDRSAFEPLRDRLVSRRETLVREETELQERLEDFLGRMREGRQRVEAWPLEGEGFGLFRGGLAKTYGRGRKAMAVAYQKPSVESFHEWRKRVKYHWYHARLLRSVWKAPFKVYGGELKKLSDLLGDDHDLGVMRRTFLEDPESFGPPDVLQTVLGLIDRRQDELRLKARPLGLRIFAEKPSRFEKRLRRYWDAWQFERSLQPAIDSLNEVSP